MVYCGPGSKLDCDEHLVLLLLVLSCFFLLFFLMSNMLSGRRVVVSVHLIRFFSLFGERILETQEEKHVPYIRCVLLFDGITRAKTKIL